MARHMTIQFNNKIGKNMINMKSSMRTMLIAAIMTMLPISHAFASSEPHKLVIQVSTNDPLTQKIALNNAVNLQNDKYHTRPGHQNMPGIVQPIYPDWIIHILPVMLPTG